MSPRKAPKHDPRFIQDGKPTRLARRLDSLGFQSAIDGEEPDLAHAWQHMGDDDDAMVDHLCASVLLEGYHALHRYLAGTDYYSKRMTSIGVPNTAAERRHMAKRAEVRLARLAKHDGGWDPSIDRTRIMVQDALGGRTSLDKLRDALERTNAKEANRVLLRLTKEGQAAWAVLAGKRVQMVTVGPPT